jgi:hypothetical protein
VWGTKGYLVNCKKNTIAIAIVVAISIAVAIAVAVGDCR